VDVAVACGGAEGLGSGAGAAVVVVMSLYGVAALVLAIMYRCVRRTWSTNLDDGCM
jgi:hypothetical protein